MSSTSESQETMLHCDISMPAEEQYLLNLDAPDTISHKIKNIVLKVLNDILLFDQLVNFKPRNARVFVKIAYKTVEIVNGTRGRIKDLTQEIINRITAELINNKQTAEKILEKGNILLELFPEEPVDTDDCNGTVTFDCVWTKKEAKTDSTSDPA